MPGTVVTGYSRLELEWSQREVTSLNLIYKMYPRSQRSAGRAESAHRRAVKFLHRRKDSSRPRCSAGGQDHGC